MAAIQSFRLREGPFAAALAISFLSFAGGARAQNASPPTAGLRAEVGAEPLSAPVAVTDPTCCSGHDAAPTMGIFDTMRESLCGDAGRWRPLTLHSFFSEGWHEPWAGGPAGQCGLTPRHGWLGAFEGVFYRLGLVSGTYQHDVNKPSRGEFYGSNFTTFLPFSRRFELFVNVPFLAANGTEDPTRGYRRDFGDVQVAGSFLLSESEAFTQLFTLGATLPTGEAETGGNLSAINPRYSFWSNPAGAWVVRGGSGVNIPLDDSSAKTTFQGSLAVGHYFRPSNVPFGDLVLYVNCNVTVPLEGDGPTNVGVGPGTRFQIAGNWWFLNYVEFQVGDVKPFDYQVQFAIVRAW